MSRETRSGEATLAQLGRAFGLSRQGFYAAPRGGQRPPLARLPRRGERTRGSVTVEGSNRRWAAVLAIPAHKSQEAPVVHARRQAFGEPWAVPYGRELRTAHGPQSTGSDAQELGRLWGIEPSFAPVGRPTGNAVAERLIQTLNIELI